MCFNRDWSSDSSDVCIAHPATVAKDDNQMRREGFMDKMLNFEVEEPPAFVLSDEKYVFPNMNLMLYIY